MLLLAIQIALAVVALSIAVVAARWEPPSRRRTLVIFGAAVTFIASIIAAGTGFHGRRTVDRQLAQSHDDLDVAKRQVAELVAARRPRTLTEEQRRIIVTTLKGKVPATLVAVSAFTGEPDSMALAEELRSALAEAGWKGSTDIGLHFQTTHRGLNVNARDEAVPGAADLMSALREARMDPRLVTNPNWARGDVINISVDAR